MGRRNRLRWGRFALIALTRRYRFPAAHVLSCSSFSSEENEAVYGKCANPNGHGHDYGLEVTVRGPLDPITGQIAPLSRLDAAVRDRVLEQLSHSLLNEHPAFRQLVPTAENIAEVIFRMLAGPIADLGEGIALDRVHLVETRRNSVELDGAEGVPK